MAPNGGRKKKDVGGPNEAAKLSLELKLRELANGRSGEVALPSSLSVVERAWVHERAAQLGLRTKSRGTGPRRFVTVYKRSESTLVRRDATLALDQRARKAVADLIDNYPITQREKDELAAACPPPAHRAGPPTFDSIASHPPAIPRAPQPSPELLAFRRTLPVSAHAERILDAIESHRVVVVVGDTGSGKTTQIPQLLLERHRRDSAKCRIVCTQPRRISAISVAERVAYERNEKIGSTVGYQIRSESRTGPETLLTYCTNGVLLRALAGSGPLLANVTHVLADEVHERDRLADFMLISLKDAVAKRPDLRVVLMSATADSTMFSEYFDGCPVLTIPGRAFDVTKFYLDDVLPMMRYESEAMRKSRRFQKKPKETAPQIQKAIMPPEVGPIDPDLQADMNEFLNDCYANGSPDSFGQILYMYISEGVPIDCPHSETGMTGLMAAARYGYLDTIEEILKMGGDPSVIDKSGKRAYDYALAEGRKECADILKNLTIDVNVSTPVKQHRNENNDDLLERYLQTVEDDAVDYDLVLSIIKYLHLTQPKGSILVFLTGYDDIMFLKEAIQSCVEIRHGTYQLFVLHSNMQTADQKKIFAKCPASRKIILSTNIAETSITIDDVVYVIDSGKVKQTGFESMSEVSYLHRCWISKACALQRIGRAGRTQPGKAYLMYSKKRFESFADQTTAEILRVPLHELCLHTKVLAASNTPIADYLAKAIEPPASMNVRNSVALLKTIGALSPMEDLTEIGQHLLGLSIEPKLGKMILYSCILKCLDPVLTIACCLATKEPFQIVPDRDKKKGVQDLRKEFAAESLSDHMVLLRVFQAWQVARASKIEKNFCDKNYISKATMETIVTVRAQILTQLRILGFVKSRGVSDIKDLNQNSDKWYIIKAALVGGLYPSVARIDKEESTVRSSREAKLMFHPRSALYTDRGKAGLVKALNKIPSEWLVYEEIIRIGRICFIRCNTAITPLTVALFGGPLRLSSTAIKMNLPGMSDDSDSDQEEGDEPRIETSCLSLDDWISFIALSHDVLSVYFLRQKFSSMIIRRMLYPARTGGQMDDKILSTLVQVLAAEERRVGLIQPLGIFGAVRPKSMESQNVGRMPTATNEHMYDNKPRQNSFYNSNVPFGAHKGGGGHFFKQGKSGQSPVVFQNFSPNKGPLSPSSGGNALLANIEKYANSSGVENSAAIFQNTKYFVIRTADPALIETSQNDGLWNFSKTTLRKLIMAIEIGFKVILFFSIGEAVSKFFGFAEFSSVSGETDTTIHPVKWLCNQSIPHHLTRNMINTMNDNRRVFASVDGQEISADSGRALILLLDQNGKKNRNNGRPIQKQIN